MDVIKTNCRQLCLLEGYASNIKSGFDEEKSRDFLKFTFTMWNTDPVSKDVYGTSLPVIVYRNSANIVKQWIKEGMLVEVQGKLKVLKDNAIGINASYIEDARPRNVTIKQTQEA